MDQQTLQGLIRQFTTWFHEPSAVIIFFTVVISLEIIIFLRIINNVDFTSNGITCAFVAEVAILIILLILFGDHLIIALKEKRWFTTLLIVAIVIILVKTGCQNRRLVYFIIDYLIGFGGIYWLYGGSFGFYAIATGLAICLFIAIIVIWVEGTSTDWDI